MVSSYVQAYFPFPVSEESGYKCSADGLNRVPSTGTKLLAFITRCECSNHLATPAPILAGEGVGVGVRGVGKGQLRQQSAFVALLVLHLKFRPYINHSSVNCGIRCTRYNKYVSRIAYRFYSGVSRGSNLVVDDPE